MTVSSQIIEVLNDLCMKFGLAIDWSQENVLPYVQELAGKYISWEVATSKMWIWFGAALLVLGIILAVVDLYGEVSGAMLTAFIAVPLVVAGVVIIMTQAMDILTCEHLPEKQILEYVTSMIQSR